METSTSTPSEADEDGGPRNTRYTDRKPNLWDRLTFGFLTGVMLKGAKRPLGLGDLRPLHTHFTSDYTSEQVLRLWRRKYHREPQLDNHSTNRGSKEDLEVLTGQDDQTKSISMVWLTMRAFWADILYAIILNIAEVFAFLAPPLFIGRLMDFLSDPSAPITSGFAIAGAVLAAQQLQTLLSAHLNGALYDLGIKCSAAYSSAIYQKTLRISSKSSKQFTTGDIMNLVAVDLQNIMWSIVASNAIWGSPLSVTLSFMLISQYLGLSTLAAVTLMVLFIPIAGGIAKIQASLQKRQMVKKDARIAMLTEILNNIKVIKLYGWEESFKSRIATLRAMESRLMYIYIGVSNALKFIWNSYPFMMSLSAVAAYLVLDPNGSLTPKMVLVAITYFKGMSFDLLDFPEAVALAVKAVVSLNRIRHFLEAEEVDRTIIRDDDLEPNEEIYLNKASFAWADDEAPVLKTVDLSVRKGELVAVVGAVAAGKSSLISAILGEMRPTGVGSVHRRKSARLALVPQQAWIENNTLRNNVLFGSPLRSSVYKDVLKRCCLMPDLKVLPAGDSTEIGEKGVNLSGGQKQRVSLARAVYQDADIYLLDDPLSAVDAHVAQSLFRDIIGPQGLLRHKTRVLVTHCLAILPQVDRIVVLDEGEIIQQGTYDEIMRSDVRLKELIETHANAPEQSENAAAFTTERNDLINVAVDGSSGNSLTTTGGDSRCEKTLAILQRAVSTQSARSSQGVLEHPERQLSGIPSGRITEDEEMQSGKVLWSVYFRFLSKFGFFSAFVTFAGYAAFKASDTASLYYITLWSDSMQKSNCSNITQLVGMFGERGCSNPKTDSADIWLHMEVYMGLGGAQALSILLGLTALAFGCVRTSTILHNDMLLSVLRSPMRFFDSTPTGRVVNRSSRDIDELDVNLYNTMDGYLEMLVNILVIVATIVIQVPPFLGVILPLLVIFFALQRFYMASSRQILRLGTVTYSPVLSSFNESVAGIVTIRAYGRETNFVERNKRLLDNNQNAVYHEYNGFRWIQLRANMIGQILAFGVICILTLLKSSHSLDPAEATLLFALSLQASNSFTWFVRLGPQVENSFVSAERVLEYCNLTPEAEWHCKDDDKLDPAWPSRGKVVFDKYSTRYADHLDLVVRDIDLEIGSAQKVALVGRTGAGKSSLTLGILRVIEAAGGRIYIDGVDISTVGLHALRSRVALIPQDPVLFKGSLRENVDPEGRYSDEAIWTALERAHLKISDKHLSFQLDEGGSNLSVGERQLICLSRALLRGSRLLVLDEPTASVDLDTDTLVQSTIREHFRDCSVITIAHRLHTIIDYDMIVVLDQGRIVEVGTPQDLLSNCDGVFHSMAIDANIKIAWWSKLRMFLSEAFANSRNGKQQGNVSDNIC